MTVDLLSATSDGFFALLDAAIDAETAEVATDPTPIEPGDTSDRRYVIIGDIGFANEGAKGEQEELLEVEIVVIYRGTQRSELHILMHLVRDALDGALPEAAGVHFGTIDFIDGASSRPAADGVTRAGVLNFQVSAEPA